MTSSTRSSHGTVPQLEPSDLKLGDALGGGEFGVVYTVALKRSARCSINAASTEYSESLFDQASLIGDATSELNEQLFLPTCLQQEFKQEYSQHHSVHPDNNKEDEFRLMDLFARHWLCFDMDLTDLRKIGDLVWCSDHNDPFEDDEDDDDNNNNDNVFNPHGGTDRRDEVTVERQSIRAMDAPSDTNSSYTDSINSNSNSINKNNKKRQKQQYAVKTLRQGLLFAESQALAHDLAHEAKIWSIIPKHPNILTLRATVGVPGSLQFMIVMDRLTMTLRDKIRDWNQMVTAGTFSDISLRSLLRRNLDVVVAVTKERMRVVYGIVSAMTFLHRHGIIYRDLKPYNMGFDVRGTIRLFDFGTARTVTPAQLVRAPDAYLLTGLTGSRRYMAPEVVLSRPYGFKADVYSFSIVLWQMLALQTPFDGYDRKMHFEQVVERVERPDESWLVVPANFPSGLRQIMVAGWSEHPANRPSFEQIGAYLQNLPFLGLGEGEPRQ